MCIYSKFVRDIIGSATCVCEFVALYAVVT